ncbi:MAG: hypothetical protein ABH828_02725 [archaeon]
MNKKGTMWDFILGASKYLIIILVVVILIIMMTKNTTKEIEGASSCRSKTTMFDEAQCVSLPEDCVYEGGTTIEGKGCPSQDALTKELTDAEIARIKELNDRIETLDKEKDKDKIKTIQEEIDKLNSHEARVLCCYTLRDYTKK